MTTKDSKDNQTDENLLDHDYDGIQELDNPMPTWWIWSFLLAIIFSFIYMIHYHTGAGPSLSDEFERDMAEHKEKFAVSVSSPSSELSPEELAAKVIEMGETEMGRTAYVRVCQSCHGPNLEGSIGPNLVDSFWIHDQGSFTSVLNIINNGLVEKGMPPWKDVLKGDEAVALVALIYARRGSQPANAKAPQGEEVSGYLK